jgi:hypothetical protein
MDRERITELLAQICARGTSDQVNSRLRVMVTHLVELSGDAGDDYIRLAAATMAWIADPTDGPAAIVAAYRRVGQ